VALLGWSSPNNTEIMSLEELIRDFDYRNINKSPAVFDIVKLRWMNSEYIKMMDGDKFFNMALPYIKEVISKDLDYRRISDLIKTRIETLCDIGEMIDFFEELPEYNVEMFTHKKMKTNTESSLKVLRDLLPRFEALEDYSEASIESLIKSYVSEKEIKNGQGLWPVRTAISGKQSTPGGAYEIMSILGKEESLCRIRLAIDMLEKAINE
jgi:glutamyl/glutaminyl-tRNA synthetase